MAESDEEEFAPTSLQLKISSIFDDLSEQIPVIELPDSDASEDDVDVSRPFLKPTRSVPLSQTEPILPESPAERVEPPKGPHLDLGPVKSIDLDAIVSEPATVDLDSDVATFDETQSLQLMNSLETLTVAQGNEAYRIEPCLRGASRRAGRDASAIPAAKWADIRTAAKEQEKTTIVLDLSKQREECLRKSAQSANSLPAPSSVALSETAQTGSDSDDDEEEDMMTWRREMKQQVQGIRLDDPPSKEPRKRSKPEEKKPKRDPVALSIRKKARISHRHLNGSATKEAKKETVECPTKKKTSEKEEVHETTPKETEPKKEDKDQKTTQTRPNVDDVDVDAAAKARRMEERKARERVRLKRLEFAQKLRDEKPPTSKIILFDADADTATTDSSSELITEERNPPKSAILLTISLNADGSLKLAPSAAPDTSCIESGYHPIVVLISWLLSLTPENADDSSSPFRVIGFKQVASCDGNLYLVVVAIPRRNAKSIAAFLESTTLAKVLPSCDVDVVSDVIDVSRKEFVVKLSTFVSLSDDPSVVRAATESSWGFYSVAMETHFNVNPTDAATNPETTVSTFDLKIATIRHQATGILMRGFDCGFSLAGTRLVRENGTSKWIVAWRGAAAVSAWLTEVGPKDPRLARRTDPTSLRALYGGDDSTTIACPRNAEASLRALANYFGDQTPSTSMKRRNPPGKVRQPFPRALKESSRESTLPGLVTRVSSRTLLLLAHNVVKNVGVVIATCAHRGFFVDSIRRLAPSRKSLQDVGLLEEQRRHFKTISSSSSILLNLVKENAAFEAYALVRRLGVDLRIAHPFRSIHAMNPTEIVVRHGFVVDDDDVASIPGVGATLDLALPYRFNRTLPQPSFVALVGAASQALAHILVAIAEHSTIEFLGVKIVRRLASYHAKALTPYEVGSKQWHASVRELTGKRVALILVRGICVDDVIKSRSDLLVSSTVQEAIRLAHCFFNEKELFFDPAKEVLKPYLPPVVAKTIPSPRGGRKKWGYRRNSKNLGGRAPGGVLRSLADVPPQFASLLVMKPHVVPKQIGNVLVRLSQAGFTVTGLKLMNMNMRDAEVIARQDDANKEWSIREISNHMKELTSGDCLVAALVAENCVKSLLDCLGDAKPDRKSAKYTLRSTYGIDRTQNGFYGSVSYATAVKDIKRFFPSGIFAENNSLLESEGILYKFSSSNDHPEDSVSTEIPQSSLPYEKPQRPPSTLNPKIFRPPPSSSSSSSSSDQTDVVNGPGYVSIATSTHNQTNSSTSTSVGLSTTGTSTSDLVASRRRFLSATRSGSLKQIACVLFFPPVVQAKPSSLPPYVELLKGFQALGFVPVALEMRWLTEEGVGELASILPEINVQIDVFCGGPSVAVALERDNAIVCFDFLVQGSAQLKQLYEKHSRSLVISQTPTRASKMLDHFF